MLRNGDGFEVSGFWVVNSSSDLFNRSFEVVFVGKLQVVVVILLLQMVVVVGDGVVCNGGTAVVGGGATFDWCWSWWSGVKSVCDQ